MELQPVHLYISNLGCEGRGILVGVEPYCANMFFRYGFDHLFNINVFYHLEIVRLIYGKGYPPK